MTQREQQILNIIEKDPMISQEELARQTGMSRSAAAVHISNLIKKGYIAGRGYVLRKDPYAVVVGGVNIDIGGTPFEQPVAKDSNPGSVTVSLGGVGRNIAHNLRLLGTDVRFLTAIGDDIFAQKVTDSCYDLGIDITYALRTKDAATSTYLYINDAEGDMALALSDMSVCDLITPGYLSDHQHVINNGFVTVADANIPEASLVWLAENSASPVFVDPVSTAKAHKLKNILGKIHTLKPNKLEAEVLTGIKIVDEESLRSAAQALLDTGLQRVFISMGRNGVLAADHDEMLHVTAVPAKALCSTGAGDAFMAALVCSYERDLSLEETAKMSAAAASLAVESYKTINDALSVEAVRERAATIN